MKIAVKKIDNDVYIDSISLRVGRFSEETLIGHPYNFKIIEIPDEYVDTVSNEDFDENLNFDIYKYNKRKYQELAEQEIIELKQKLADTDFKAIKYAEGYYTEEQYAGIKAQRQAWRDRINELEA